MKTNISKTLIKFPLNKEMVYSNKSVKDKIYTLMYISNKKIFHVNKITDILGIDRNDVASSLAQNKNIFVNIIKNHGYWCLKNNQPTEDVLEEFMIKNGLKIKKLVMLNNKK